jgi:quercetin 2,3-dioxygenase
VSNLDALPGMTDVTRSHAVTEVFEPREVPLGGIRAMRVERVMPQRGLPTVGAWCFLDSFGPHDVQMRVLPHPHTGLQTVTWPLAGEIHHRDSLGSDVLVRPGQLNLMTAGRGVSHSEFSVSHGVLHGLQLWVALPVERAAMAPAFEQHVDLPVYDGVATVLMGTLGDVTSPATTHTPLVGADVTVDGRVALPLRPGHEHAVLAMTDRLSVAGTDLPRGRLLYLGAGRAEVVLAGSGRALLLGGEPLRDDLVMWWNFVGRSHEEIVEARAAWAASDELFGTVAGHGGARVPAPDLPGVRLAPRRRRVAQPPEAQ